MGPYEAELMLVELLENTLLAGGACGRSAKTAPFWTRAL